MSGPAAEPNWKVAPPNMGNGIAPSAIPKTMPIPKAIPSTSLTRRSESPRKLWTLSSSS